MLEQMHQKEMEENAAAMVVVEPSHPQLIEENQMDADAMIDQENHGNANA